MPASLKHYASSAVSAWCPIGARPAGTGHALMAAGTVAGAVDVTFSTHSVLEIVSMDFSSGDDAPVVLGSVQAPERFNRVAWGPRLQTEPGYPQMGIIAGGLADGSVCLWDPAAILSGQGQPLLARMQKHTGAVKGLEFNAFSPSLLATGAADSDLCIWDITKPSTPSLYPALKGVAPPAGTAAGEITCISWNRKVQHILASSSSNGTTVVWDLKRQKPVISFRDPSSQRRASALQWNPEVATQLVVASDDDRSPTLQMWDLRNSVSPLKEFVGHSKGVLGMAWSPHDPSLLLSTAKDNRTICWDVHSTDMLCELPVRAGNWNFDVQWCPQIPGVFSTSSFDGRVGIHNLLACTSAKVAESVNPDFSVTQHEIGEAQPLRKAPQWMKRPCGVSFGFGGRLVSFANHKAPALDHHMHPAPGGMRDQGLITISQVVTEHELVERSEQFEQAIAGGEKQTLQEYCASKAQGIAGAGDTDESEAWSFLALLFEGDGRRELLKRLGFEDVVVAQQAAAAAAAQANGVDVAAVGMDAMNLGQEGKAQAPEDFFGGAEDDPDFFDKLPEEGIMAGTPSPPAQLDPAAAFAGGHADADANHVGHEGSPEGSVELEEEIQRAMIAGNYEAAVESCFKANRLADALLIANVFNRDLFKSAMFRYMKKCPKPYMHIVRANVDGDWETLVRTRPVGRWQETLALLATYTGQEHWTTLCDMLAARLNAAGMHHAASLCYVCSGNVDAAVGYWARSAGGSAKLEALQTVVEKAIIMGLATGNKKASGALADLVTTYASILAAQGRMSIALDYLEHVPGEASPTVATLRDRIYRSGAAIPPGTPPPPFPFVQEDVRPAPGAGAAISAYGAPVQAAQAAYAPYAQTAPPYPTIAPATSTTAAPYTTRPPQPTPYTPTPPAPATSTSPYASAYTAPTATANPMAHTAQAPPPFGASAATTAGAARPAPPPPAYAPTTTSAAAVIAAQQAQQAQQAAQQQALQKQQAQQQQQQAAAIAAYNAATAAPPQQQMAAPPSYSEPVYQARRSVPPPAPAVPPPSLAPPPLTNPYTSGTPTPPAAPSPTASQAAQHTGFGMPRVSNSTPMPITSQPAQPASYFVPTTTPVSASIPPASAPLQSMGGSGNLAAASAAMPAAMPGMVPGPTTGAMPSMASPAVAAPATAPPKPQPPPPPPGPPANISVSTADTSRVPPEQQPIVASLVNLHSSCTPFANNPAKKREMDDNSKKLGQLLWRLNAGEVSAGVLPKLIQLCQAIDAADWHTANHIQVQMTTTDWDECGYWLSAVKRLIKMRMQGM